ncbi:MAG: FprA family A-type flavoprotein [Dysgonamonadaceae bacterium]|jgi:flavorubredoxin|nr:FprA family A-type flavoprotein [Dysgonamonadaceae bacterium]
MPTVEIKKDIFYVGVNDRTKQLFESLWPLPEGVSYNSYLISDEKTALFDTVDICYSDVFFEKLADALKGKPLDYLIINHMEPDHSGSLGLLRTKYPRVEIIGNARTLDMVKGYYGITEGLRAIKDKDEIVLGKHCLQFFLTPMIHWPETMMTYEKTQQVIFSGDAFGSFGALNGGITDAHLRPEKYWDEMIRYYSNIVGKYGSPVQKALALLSGTKIRAICSTHGPVWTEEENIRQVIGLYNRLSKYETDPGAVIAYGSMYGHTERMAETIALELAQSGVRDIAVHNVSHTHHSFILRDIFKYDTLILGSPTYNNNLYPEIESLISKIEGREIKHHRLGYFGSFTWAGAAVKRLSAFAEKSGWEIVGTPVEMKQAPTLETIAACTALAHEVAGKKR